MGDAKKKPAAARGPKRTSPRGRAGGTSPSAPVLAPVLVAVPLRAQQVDEEQVQAAFGAHAHHSNVDSITSSIAITVAAVPAPVASGSTAVSGGGGGGAGVVSTDATSLQSLAQQQDAYRRKLEQLQKQHELQQQQWQARQQAHLQQQLKIQEQAERQDRMQHIQQKLHERIQQKQLHGSSGGSSSGSPSPVASAQAAAATAAAAVQHMRQAIIRKEEKELSQSLAEHQIQLYKTMMRDLEMQSGISMTPLPSPATPGLHQQQIQAHGPPVGSAAYGALPPTAGVAAAATSSAELIPAPIVPGTTLDPPTTKAYEDFQRTRQEQLLRLQQYQLEQSKKMQQHVGAAGGASASPSAVRTQTVTSEDAIRQQLLVEQERLRVLQMRELQPHAIMHSREPPVSAQEQLLIQQHDILRQQQILQGLLQRQQQERQQQQTAAARSLQQQQQQQQQAQQKKTPATNAAKKTAAPSTGDGAQTSQPPAKKRKKAKSSPESQMEALVRELIRLNSATNATEIRTGLDKITAWVHRSFDVELLKFAQRDFREIVLAKRPSLMQANQWTSDIQVKCEYIVEKIAQVIMAISVQQQTAKAQESTSSSTAVVGTGATSSTDQQSNAIRLAAKEHAYAALKAQMLQPKGKSKAGGGTAASKASSSQGGSATGGEKKKQPLLVDLSLINPKQKAANVNAKAQQQTDSVAHSTGKPSESTASAVAAKPATAATATTASVPASTPKPAVKAATPQPKSASVAPPAALSPRVVQQLYEVDLTTRSCTVTQEEGEDKFYIPVKSIAKVMRRALPDDSAPKPVAAAASAIRSSSIGDRTADSAGDAMTAARDAGGDNADAAEEKQQKDSVKNSGGPDQGDEEMKTGEEEPKTSSTSSVSLAALALQKRKELVQKNLLHGSSLPPIKIDDDAVVFMQECVTEFILYLTSEAKDHCAMDKKKTASLLGSHVVQGMDNLGFTTYAKVLDNFNGKIKKLQDAQIQKRVEKKLQDKKQKQEQKQLEAAEAAAKAKEASSAAAGLNGVPEAQSRAATAGSVQPATGTEVASVKSEATPVAITATTGTTPSQQEQTLMTREDRSAELQAA